jgi:hypothetical protein
MGKKEVVAGDGWPYGHFSSAPSIPTVNSQREAIGLSLNMSQARIVRWVQEKYPKPKVDPVGSFKFIA